MLWWNVESMFLKPAENAWSRSFTVRGLLWLLLSLGLAFAAIAVGLLRLTFLLSAQPLEFNSALQLGYAWDALLIASGVIGFIAFTQLVRGRLEYGPEHAANMRSGVAAFAVAAGSALTLFVTGTVLGFVYVPASTPLGWTVRSLHSIAPTVVLVFVGLFLLWTLWRLGGGVSRGVSAAAFGVALTAPALWVLALANVLMPFTASTELFLDSLPLLSMGLWMVACLLAMIRLRGAAPSPRPNATGA